MDFIITTEEELEALKKYLSIDEKITGEYSIDDYVYLICIGMKEEADSVRLCEGRIYFHYNSDGMDPKSIQGEHGYTYGYTYGYEEHKYNYIAFIPKGLLEENNVEVGSVQDKIDYLERLSNIEVR